MIADIKLRLANPGLQPRDFAILCRTNEQPRPFEMALRREKLPYVLIGGQSFYDRREVKDILAYLRLLDNPSDEPSLLRIINVPPRGIGQATVKALLQRAIEQGTALWNILSSETADPVRRFCEMIDGFRRRAGTESMVGLAKALIAQIRYQDELARQYPDANDQQSRWASVQDVINTLAAYEKRSKKPTLRSFLDEVALGQRDEAADRESKLDRNAIALMTLHSAKGLEFPHVYLAGMEEGLLPHQKSIDAEKHGNASAIDEERRLCYVGVTRARDCLTMTLALARMKWGKSRPTIPSRFLYELTGQAENRAKSKERRAETAAKTNRGLARRFRRGGLIARLLSEKEVHQVAGADQSRAGKHLAGWKSRRSAQLNGERFDAFFDLLFRLRAELRFVAANRFQLGLERVADIDDQVARPRWHAEGRESQRVIQIRRDRVHRQVVEILIPLRQPCIEHAGVGNLHRLKMVGRSQGRFLAKAKHQPRPIAAKHFGQCHAGFERIEQPAILHAQFQPHVHAQLLRRRFGFSGPMLRSRRVGRRLAISQIDDAYPIALLGELGQGAAAGDLHIIRMRADGNHVEWQFGS